MVASRDIPPSTAFLYVPSEMMINKHTIEAREPPLYQDVILKNPEVFRDHEDSEYLVLVVYVFLEMIKKESSFWHDYFQVVESCDMPMLWSDSELAEFQDSVLVQTV